MGAGDAGVPSDSGASQATMGQGDQFADAVLALLAVARRTRGRFQPLFEDVTVPQLVLLDAVQACGREGIAAIATATVVYRGGKA